MLAAKSLFEFSICWFWELYWCFSVGDAVFFVETRDLFCFKQAEKVPKIPVYRLFTPGCERSWHPSVNDVETRVAMGLSYYVIENKSCEEESWTGG